MFHAQSRNDSAPNCGTTPQGKGREGIRKGMERNATAILLVVEGGHFSFKLKSVTREGI